MLNIIQPVLVEVLEANKYLVANIEVQDSFVSLIALKSWSPSRFNIYSDGVLTILQEGSPEFYIPLSYYLSNLGEEALSRVLDCLIKSLP
jgi:hypothetical protein